MTVIKHPNQRVGIFIDTQNLYHSARKLYDARVNFDAMIKDVLDNRTLVRAIAYVITTKSGEETAFFEALTKMGIETKTQDLKIFSDGAKKADWDVGIVVDAISLAPKLDVVVFATGDGDFVDAINYLKALGCQIEVVSFGASASSKLREVADDFIDMMKKPRRYLIGAKKFAGDKKTNYEKNK